MTARQKVRRVLLAGGLVMALSVPTATAQTSTTSPDETVTTAPGDTVANGGPLLVPGETQPSSSSDGEEANSDNTGTVVALVISGLLVVALLLALLTYWFWRNTRPPRYAADESVPVREPEGVGGQHG